MHRLPSSDQFIHWGYFCDKCGKKPLSGTRYHCQCCADFDLCEKCAHDASSHDKSHTFIALGTPTAPDSLLRCGRCFQCPMLGPVYVTEEPSRKHQLLVCSICLPYFQRLYCMKLISSKEAQLFAERRFAYGPHIPSLLDIQKLLAFFSVIPDRCVNSISAFCIDASCLSFQWRLFSPLARASWMLCIPSNFQSSCCSKNVQFEVFASNIFRRGSLGTFLIIGLPACSGHFFWALVILLKLHF